MALESILDFAALLTAGVLGALILEPAKNLVRTTADRVRMERRRL